MTDRINQLTVILERDMRDDDVEGLMQAILLLRGVLNVRPIVEDQVAQERRELTPKLYSVLDQRS